MSRFARSLLAAVVVAVVCAVLARVQMRLIAIGHRELTEFTWAGTLVICAAFVVAAAWSAACAQLPAPMVLRALVGVVPTVPVLMVAVSDAAPDITTYLAVSSGQHLMIMVLGIVIWALVVVNAVVPFVLGLRAGTRSSVPVHARQVSTT